MTTQSLAQDAKAQLRPKSNMRTIFDTVNKVEFIDKLENRAPGLTVANSLCAGVKSSGGPIRENKKTVRKLLGPNLKRIDVLWVSNFETHDMFGLAQQAISDALEKSPREIYGYQPWANTVSPEFKARLEYTNGKTGEFEMAYGYLCYQDEEGTHWWTRFASPLDLNLNEVTGVLGFKAGNGYFITQANGKRVWLNVTENKIQIAELEKMMAMKVTATGELKTMPENVTGAVPKGEDYLAYNFTIKLKGQ